LTVDLFKEELLVLYGDGSSSWPPLFPEVFSRPSSHFKPPYQVGVSWSSAWPLARRHRPWPPPWSFDCPLGLWCGHNPSGTRYCHTRCRLWRWTNTRTRQAGPARIINLDYKKRRLQYVFY
jgi:hypothetical protein